MERAGSGGGVDAGAGESGHGDGPGEGASCASQGGGEGTKATKNDLEVGGEGTKATKNDLEVGGEGTKATKNDLEVGGEQKPDDDDDDAGGGEEDSLPQRAAPAVQRRPPAPRPPDADAPARPGVQVVYDERHSGPLEPFELRWGRDPRQRLAGLGVRGGEPPRATCGGGGSGRAGAPSALGDGVRTLERSRSGGGGSERGGGGGSPASKPGTPAVCDDGSRSPVSRAHMWGVRSSHAEPAAQRARALSALVGARGGALQRAPSDEGCRGPGRREGSDFKQAGARCARDSAGDVLSWPCGSRSARAARAARSPRSPASPRSPPGADWRLPLDGAEEEAPAESSSDDEDRVADERDAVADEGGRAVDEQGRHNDAAPAARPPSPPAEPVALGRGAALRGRRILAAPGDPPALPRGRPQLAGDPRRSAFGAEFFLGRAEVQQPGAPAAAAAAPGAPAGGLPGGGTPVPMPAAIRAQGSGLVSALGAGGLGVLAGTGAGMPWRRVAKPAMPLSARGRPGVGVGVEVDGGAGGPVPPEAGGLSRTWGGESAHVPRGLWPTGGAAAAAGAGAELLRLGTGVGAGGLWDGAPLAISGSDTTPPTPREERSVRDIMARRRTRMISAVPRGPPSIPRRGAHAQFPLVPGSPPVLHTASGGSAAPARPPARPSGVETRELCGGPRELRPEARAGGGDPRCSYAGSYKPVGPSTRCRPVERTPPLERRALAPRRCGCAVAARAARAPLTRPPPPPAPLRTNRTRHVPHPVLIGHAASLTPY